MDTDRARSAVFFIAYFLLLVYGLVWVQFGYVRERVGDNINLFYVLDGLAICYVCLRGYLVIGKRVSRSWESIYLAIDLIIITGLVRLTGGIRSEAALMYFLPVATSSIQRRLSMTVLVGLGGAALYTAATWTPDFSANEMAMLSTRVFVLLLVTLLAARYALTESARVEEFARLREKVALGDYRARLSREMHDGIQHYLVNIAARLQLARLLMKKDPSRAAQMAIDQRFTIGQAADELRYLVRHLRSPVVERQGFVDALREHVSMFADRSGASVALEVEGTPTALLPDVEQAVLRIVQEALTNTQKHAQAGEAKVRLRFGSEVFVGVIADNGVGFDPSDTPEEPGIEGGLGLASMRERAESVGGSLQVNSVPGQGTKISFTVPNEGHDTSFGEDIANEED